jgi:hypothetical protein
VLRAQLADLAKISHRRDDDSGLALNRFDEERGDVFAMQLERSSDVIDLAISDGVGRIAITVLWTHALEVWSKSIPALRVRAHAAPSFRFRQSVTHTQMLISPDDADRASMEVPCGAENNRAAFRYPFRLVGPLARELDARLDCLSPRVHRQNHIISKDLGDLLGEGTENGIVECSRGQRQTLSLLNQGGHDARVAVALIDGTGSRVRTMVSDSAYSEQRRISSRSAHAK